MAGISHLHNHPELYIESISDDSWENYIRQMSLPGTWCDHLIIQAVANALNCVIHIIDSNANRPHSYSQYWTGTSLQWRLMRGTKIFLILK